MADSQVSLGSVHPAVPPYSGSSPAAPPSAGSDLNAWSLAASLLQQRRAATTVALVILAIGVPLVFFLGRHPTYTSSASFITQGSGSTRMSGLSALAGRYGVNVGGGDPGENPRFYADLLQSRRILAGVRDHKYVVRDYPAGTDLVEIFGRDPSPIGRERALRDLSESIDVSGPSATGLIRFGARAAAPELARQIAEQVLVELGRYNDSTRRTQAAAERQFVEGRLKEARLELAAVESDLRQFLTQNAQYDRAPHLRLAHNRLQMELGLRQTLVSTLAESYEEARIEEVRNTPIISIVEPPETPILADSRRRLQKLLLVLITALAVAVATAFIRSALEDAKRRDPTAYHEFQRAWRRPGGAPPA